VLGSVRTVPRSAAEVSAADRRRPGRPRRPARAHRPLWLLLPGSILMTVVIVIPFVVAVVISLLDLDQYTFRQWLSAPFIGIANFVEAVTGSAMPHATWVCVSAALIATAGAVPLGVLGALTTQDRFRGRALVRSLYLLPYVLPAFVVGTVWRVILQLDGVANHWLAQLGIDGGLWLNGPKAYWTLIIVQMWAAWPLVYLLVLAGLSSIGPELHEAAALDGASRWTKLRFVILPLLRGPISLGAIITVLHLVNAFTLPFVLFGVPSPHDVEVLPVLTYVESFQNFRFGLSAAMAVLSLLLILVPLLVYLRAVRLDTGDEGRRA
jgi:multiple sugar transport system permease protein